MCLLVDCQNLTLRIGDWVTNCEEATGTDDVNMGLHETEVMKANRSEAHYDVGHQDSNSLPTQSISIFIIYNL